MGLLCDPCCRVGWCNGLAAGRRSCDETYTVCAAQPPRPSISALSALHQCSPASLPLLPALIPPRRPEKGRTSICALQVSNSEAPELLPSRQSSSPPPPRKGHQSGTCLCGEPSNGLNLASIIYEPAPESRLQREERRARSMADDCVTGMKF